MLRVFFRKMAVKGTPTLKLVDSMSIPKLENGEEFLLTIIKEKIVPTEIPALEGVLQVGEENEFTGDVGWRMVFSDTVVKNNQDKHNWKKARQLVFQKVVDGAASKGLITPEDRVVLYQTRYGRRVKR